MAKKIDPLTGKPYIGYTDGFGGSIQENLPVDDEVEDPYSWGSADAVTPTKNFNQQETPVKFPDPVGLASTEFQQGEVFSQMQGASSTLLTGTSGIDEEANVRRRRLMAGGMASQDLLG